MNEQFSSVFTDEPAGELTQLDQSLYDDMPAIEVHTGGVRKLLRNIKLQDNIPARIRKEAADELAPSQALIIQASLNQATLPEEWKSARVAPIFKKGDRCTSSNYRPVSLICISCKLMEHVISSNIMKHLELHKILNDAQHGFRKRRSCKTQLI